MSNSALVRFYIGQGPDSRGRMIGDIFLWDEAKLESVHDYIQWLFPLKEKSAYNASAPTLTEEDVVVLNTDRKARLNLLHSLALFITFYGFDASYTGSGKLVMKRSKNFDSRSSNWLTPGNHNFLRITRILKSLVLLDYKMYASAFLAALEDVYKDNSAIIGPRTLGFWKEALTAS